MQHDFEPDRDRRPSTRASLATEAPSIEVDDVATRHTKKSGVVAGGKTLFRWLQMHTFSSKVLPDHWSHPVWGYVSAIIGQIAAVSLTAGLTYYFSTFRFPAAFELLVILLVALGWGVGPSLVATFAGAALLIFLLLPPYFSLTVARVEDIVGVLFYICIGLTISILTSQAQRARHKAQALAQRLEAIFDALPDPLVFYNAESKPIRFNQAAYQILPLDLHTPDGERISALDDPIAHALKGEHITEVELCYQSPADENERIVSISAAPIYAASDTATIIGAVTITRDVTVQHQLQDRLRAAEHEASVRATQLETIFDAITDGVLIHDGQQKIPYMNRAASTLIGLSEGMIEDTMPSPPFELIDQQGLPLPYDQWPEARIARGEWLQGDQAVDVLLQTHDNRKRYLSVTGAPLFDNDGRVKGGVLVCRDVTERRQMEEDLRKSEELYRTIVQTANEGIWLVDQGGDTLYLNDRMATMLGGIAAEIVGQPITAFIFPEDELQGRARLRNNLRGRTEQFEFRFRRIDGRSLHIQASTSPVQDTSGNIVSVLGLFTDITTRKQAEYALQLSEERLQIALKNSAITLYQQDSDLRYTWMHNPLPAFTPESIVGKGDADFMLPEEAQHLTDLKRRVLATGEGIQEEIRTTSDAGIIIDELTIEPLRDIDGTIVGVTGTAIDITERKHAEEERIALLARAQQSEYRFQRLFEANLIGLMVADEERIYEANDAFLHMVGYTPADLEEKPLSWQDITPSEYAFLIQPGIKDLLTLGECQPIEKEYLRKDKSRVPVLVGAVTTAENPLRWISFVLDLSEQKRLEQETRARARELEVLFESMTDGVMVYDDSGYIVQANTAAQAQLMRYIQPEEAIGVSVYERAQRVKPQGPEGHPLESQQIPVIRILNGETIPGSKAQDVRVRTLADEEIWLNMTGTPLRDETGKITGAITIARDVTERRQQELRTRNALEALMEMAQVVVQGTMEESKDDAETTQTAGAGTATPLRRVMQRLAQLTLKVLGCHRLGFTHIEPGTELMSPLGVAGLPPEQEQQWWREQEGQQVHLTDGGDLALVDRLRTNEILLLDMSEPPYNEQPNPYGIKQMLTAPMVLGTSLLGLLTLDYGGLDHTYTSEEMALTRAVTKLAALAIERDQLLTEAAQARANELAAQEAARLKDEFIGIASHELRTPMTTMKANLQLAQRQLHRFMQQQEPGTQHPLGQLPHFLERTEQQLKRQQRLVQDLLDASRIETGHLELHPAPCDLVALLQETVEDQQQVTPKRTIQVSLPACDTVMVMADSDRVSQVVSNYLSNALKYSDADKPVEVSLQLINGEARLAVRDQGPGLSQAQQQRIWERFYRVPDVHVRTGSGVGLGLGLHISRTIIERQGGKVGVESEQGKGSTFWFVFPLLSMENEKEMPPHTDA